MRFTKYHGLGNDFIFLEDFEGLLLPQGEFLAQKLCHRNFGIGADGLVLIVKDAGLYTMRIFNADGTEAEMCGNAIRCMADYLLQEGLVSGQLLHIGSLGGTKEVRVEEGTYIVDMGEPDFSTDLGEKITVLSQEHPWTIYPVSMGNPHGVVFVEDLADLDFEFWGPRLESDPIWPNKANIEFAQVLSSNHLKVMVWERGAGPTLACGTGACAATVVAIKQGLVTGPTRVSLPGGDLSIEWGPNNRVYMSGPATKVFTGDIKLK
ncbi:MAG: diaminopimelate epimerase [Firmicutes bacterium]|nr:diaminopimelate epimerase [Bacillota bacterium]